MSKFKGQGKNQEGNSGNRNTVLVIVLVVLVGLFLYYKGANSNDDDSAEDDAIDDRENDGYDFSGLKAAVDATEINGMGWKDFADSRLITRNNGGKASEVLQVIIDNVVKNEGWVENLKKPAEWASMTLHKYVILHAMGLGLKGCKLKPKNDGLGEFELNHTRSMNGYFDLGNCKAEDFSY